MGIPVFKRSHMIVFAHVKNGNRNLHHDTLSYNVYVYIYIYVQHYTVYIYIYIYLCGVTNPDNFDPSCVITRHGQLQLGHQLEF